MFEPGDNVVLIDDTREIVDFGSVISINDDVVVIRSEDNNEYVGYGLDTVDVLRYRLVEEEEEVQLLPSPDPADHICSVLDIYNKYNKYTCH